jgi:predicted CoA-substrate-specific enzyme activase
MVKECYIDNEDMNICSQTGKAVITAAVVAGSETTKALLLTKENNYVWTTVNGGKESSLVVAQQALDEVVSKAGISMQEINTIVATGTGASNISFASDLVSEVLCFARGICCLLPSVKTLIDLGARKSLVIKCHQGKVKKASSSGKCAAGSGINLKMLVNVLRTKIDDLDRLYFLSKQELEIQSPCAVFGESEIISLLHNGAKAEDVVKGFIKGLAARVYSQIIEVGLESDVTVTGGVSASKAMIHALQQVIGIHITIPDHPEVVDALGAAIIGREKRGILQ